MESDLTTLYVLCGLPGSGKTTLSKMLSDKYSAVRYSLDEMRTSRGENNDRKLIHSMILESLSEGFDVVYDDLNIYKTDRLNLLNSLKDIQCNKILIVMTTPLEECIIRDSDRQRKIGEKIIKYLRGRYQPPTLEEGWSDIFLINGKE